MSSNRMRDFYNSEVVPAMMKKFSYKNIMQVPKIEKIVINMGVGEAKDNPKTLESAVNDLTTISGQKPVITKPESPSRTLRFVRECPLAVRSRCAATRCMISRIV